MCVTTWNCRALLAHDPAVFKRKWCIVDATIRDSDVVVLQEVHGSSEEMQALALRVASTHTAFSSAGVPESAVGILIFVRVHRCEGARIEETVIVPGRILGVRIVTAEATLAILGVHNYNIGVGAIATTQRWICDTTTRHLGAVLFAAGTGTSTKATTASSRRLDAATRHPTALDANRHAGCSVVTWPTDEGGHH